MDVMWGASKFHTHLRPRTYVFRGNVHTEKVVGQLAQTDGPQFFQRDATLNFVVRRVNVVNGGVYVESEGEGEGG